jgi:hypothetical protein
MKIAWNTSTPTKFRQTPNMINVMAAKDPYHHIALTWKRLKEDAWGSARWPLTETGHPEKDQTLCGSSSWHNLEQE